MDDEITQDEITKYEEFLEGETYNYRYAIQQGTNYVRRKAHGQKIAPGCYHIKRLLVGDSQWRLQPE